MCTYIYIHVYIYIYITYTHIHVHTLCLTPSRSQNADVHEKPQTAPGKHTRQSRLILFKNPNRIMTHCQNLQKENSKGRVEGGGREFWTQEKERKEEKEERRKDWREEMREEKGEEEEDEEKREEESQQEMEETKEETISYWELLLG